jgi:hypothetical protein
MSKVLAWCASIAIKYFLCDADDHLGICEGFGKTKRTKPRSLEKLARFVYLSIDLTHERLIARVELASMSADLV